MYILIYAIGAFLGGLTMATEGWLETGTAFDPRKFAASVLRSLGAAIIWVAANAAGLIPPVTQAQAILLFFAAFATGAGFDGLINRGAGAIKASIYSYINK